MRMVKELTDWIADELCSAKEYAEKSVEYKARGNSSLASKFKAMANEELNHAETIHEVAVNVINDLSRTITPPEEMVEKWEECHKHYVEKAAWIKQMLAL